MVAKKKGGARAPASKKAAAAKPAAKIHLHVDNLSRLGDVFQVTPKRLRDALKRYPEVSKHLKVTRSEDGKGLAKQLETADVLFGWDFDHAVVKAAPKLKWIVAHGAGVTHLMPLDWLPKGAVLTNSAGVHGERAAEYTIMAILMLNNRLPEMMTNQRKSRWEQRYNTEIAGKKLLVIGAGSVGGDTARHAKHFGMEVWGIRRSGKAHRYVDKMYRPKDLHRLLPKVDFLLMCAPDTKDTHHMIGTKELRLMKQGAGLVNYSRAGTMDYDAVRKACAAGKVSAILDVHESEPLPRTSPSWKTPNLLVTPHSSSDDTDLYTPKTLDRLMENMARFLAGKKPTNIVDPKLQY